LQVFGLMMVRNEADILRINLLYHLALGIDQFLIVDNGSTDDTPEILEELSRDTGRVHWTRDEGPYRQSEITTGLAHKAHQRGADWVVPIDADEFWHAPGGDLRGVLEQTDAVALKVQLVNFVQRREQLEATPDGLLHLTRRVALPVGPLERVADLVRTRQAGFVETMYSPKYISRPSPTLEIGMGNHTVNGLAGSPAATDEIVCLHAPLRARSSLEVKMVDHGRRVDDLALPGQGWHVIRWHRMEQEGALELEWRANSYQDDCLDVYGLSHHLVYDPRLRDVVAPWVARHSGQTPVSSESPRPRSEGGEAGVAAVIPEAARGDRAALLQTIHEQYSAHVRAIQQLADDSGAELRARAGERDAIIRGLQAELHEKVGEANRVIADLQAEMHGKVGERDQLLSERDELIRDLEQRIRERDEIIQNNDQWIADLQQKLRAIRMSPAWHLVRAYAQLSRRLRAGTKHDGA
jgi:hypothetical protein